MARILVTGAGGFLGRTLIEELGAEHALFAGWRSTVPEAAGATLLEIDVTDPERVSRAMAAARPDLVVHGAAMSQPDDCERNPAAARAVIVDGTRHVAAAARAAGARLVHLSTDLVFEGTRGSYRETDPVGGCSVYARAKIEAEAVAAAEAADVVILRLALLYGPGTRRYPGFVDTVLGRWAAGEAMTFYVDQFRTPAPTRHVAEAVRRILARPHVRGLLHLGGADRVSRYEFARLLAEVAGAPPELVRAGTMREASGPAPRGADCSLDSRRAEERLGLRPVGCRAGLAELAASGGLIH